MAPVTKYTLGLSEGSLTIAGGSDSTQRSKLKGFST